MDLGTLFPVTDALLSKLLSLKDLETFFLRGFKNDTSQLDKPELTLEDVNHCFDVIDRDIEQDFVNSEREIILKLIKEKIPERINLSKLLDEAIMGVEKTLVPGNTKTFLTELDKNIPVSKFERKVHNNARLQHGLRIRELAVRLSIAGEQWIMEYLDETTNDGKQNVIPNLKDYIQPRILFELCKKLEEDGWIKKDTNDQFVWQYKDAEKVIPNEYDKRESAKRIKTISVREASLITLSIMINEREWMF